VNIEVKTKKSDRTRLRLLDSAVHAFSSSHIRDVSIVEVARTAELTPQAVYRYFKGKKQLFFAALQHDLDQLHTSVIEVMKSQPVASLTGATWYTYMEKSRTHPLARTVIPLRQPEILDFVASLDSTLEFKKLMTHDMILGQKYGLLRTDIDLSLAMDSMQYMMTHLLLPLIFEGKYMGSEWQKVTYAMLAVGFYPVPDLTSPEKTAQFESAMAQMIERVVKEAKSS
jgi:AcrR family transcriptional regulator